MQLNCFPINCEGANSLTDSTNISRGMVSSVEKGFEIESPVSVEE